MVWIVVIIGLCVLSLWTVLAWITHQGWNAVSGMPWEQALPKIQELPVPPWLFPDWKVWVQDFEPLLKWVMNVLNEALGWLGAGVPVVIWVIWALGALVLLLTFAALGAAAAWWKKSRKNITPSGVAL
jgi:hypothetical protein